MEDVLKLNKYLRSLNQKVLGIVKTHLLSIKGLLDQFRQTVFNEQSYRKERMHIIPKVTLIMSATRLLKHLVGAILYN